MGVMVVCDVCRKELKLDQHIEKVMMEDQLDQAFPAPTKAESVAAREGLRKVREALAEPAPNARGNSMRLDDGPPWPVKIDDVDLASEDRLGILAIAQIGMKFSEINTAYKPDVFATVRERCIENGFVTENQRKAMVKMINQWHMIRVLKDNGIEELMV